MHRPLILLLMLCLSACTAGVSGQPAHSSPAPVLAAAAPTASPALFTATAAPTATCTLFPTATATHRPTSSPTITNTPLPTATFDTLRSTPPTLMMHRSNANFDAVAFLQGFVQLLKENQIHVVTYMDLIRQPDLTAAEQGRLLILTIDDIGLQAKIDPSIQAMIAILREAGYPAVLGIITEGKLPDTETAATLKQLAGEGWELAIHTENHTNLHELEKISSYGARLEIRTCSEKIQAATGVTPITVVLPYGDMVENLKIMYKEHVQWAVGIVGGEHYRTTNQVYYVGREAPSGDPARTYQAMFARFH